jgi:pyridinium-3,5-biscarboxylic acid mononucleotide sulfurtransferase
MQATLQSKHDALINIVRGLGKVVVAYSGGVDSSVLAEVCHRELGGDALAVTAVSPSLARRELDAARTLATARGWSHRTVGTHEVGREEYARNDGDRCYWCKTELFEVLEPMASERGAGIAIGTVVDDLGDYRPGLRAAAQHRIAAPLADAGLRKADVRALARAFDLPVADKPASPCLSSRVAYGVRVTPERLRRIDRAEDFLWSLGFSDVRVRDHIDLARVEVPAPELDRAFALQERIAARLGQLGWTRVEVDPEGLRSGSLNADLPIPVIRSK